MHGPIYVRRYLLNLARLGVTTGLAVGLFGTAALLLAGRFFAAYGDLLFLAAVLLPALPDEDAGAAVELLDAPQAVSIIKDSAPASRALHFFFITEFPPSMVCISKQGDPAGPSAQRTRFSG